MLDLLLISVVLLAIAFAFIGIKMFFKKDGQFTKQCTSTDPVSGSTIDCVCGDAENDQTKCEYYQEHHGA